jgi:flagellar biogenesis protein FliO
MQWSQKNPEGRASGNAVGGLAGWLLSRLRRGSPDPRRLAVVERVTLAPRQSLALVEADGRRFLVATAAEGAPVFFPVDAPAATDEKRAPSLSMATLQALPRARRPVALAARRARW